MFYCCFVILFLYFNLINGYAKNSIFHDDPSDLEPYEQCNSSVISKVYDIIKKFNNVREVKYNSSEMTAFTLGLQEQLHEYRQAFMTDIVKLLSGKLTIAFDQDSSCCDCDAHLPESCAEALTDNSPDGVYKLHLPKFHLKPFYVYCAKDGRKNGSAWTIIQRRQDGSVNFVKPLINYVHGFGNLNGEYFLGLQKIYALTHSQSYELRIEMQDFTNEKRFALYNHFLIGNINTNYHLMGLGSYHGDAGDHLAVSQGNKFEIKYMDHFGMCQYEVTGGWWYPYNISCDFSHLNGQYINASDPRPYEGSGIGWPTWHGYYYSLKYVNMAIRPIKR